MLTGVDAERVDGLMAAAHDAPAFGLDRARTRRILELWRALPAGDPSRCHTPAFGLRFLRGGAVTLEASICWECDNIFGAGPDGPVHRGFDAGSDEAWRLFQLVAGAAGRLPPEALRMARRFRSRVSRAGRAVDREGYRICLAWMTLATAGPADEATIGEHLARLERQPDRGPAWVELEERFREWARGHLESPARVRYEAHRARIDPVLGAIAELHPTFGLGHVRTLLGVGEYLIAMDTLCDNLDSADVRLPAAVRDALYAYCVGVGVEIPFLRLTLHLDDQRHEDPDGGPLEPHR